MRMFVAGAAILGLATLGLKAPAMFVGSGKDAFFVMNFGAMALLGIVSPMLTHDLLSRERRGFGEIRRKRQATAGKPASKESKDRGHGVEYHAEGRERGEGIFEGGSLGRVCRRGAAARRSR